MDIEKEDSSIDKKFMELFKSILNKTITFNISYFNEALKENDEFNEFSNYRLMFTGDYGLINKTNKNDFFKFMAEKKIRIRKL